MRYIIAALTFILFASFASASSAQDDNPIVSKAKATVSAKMKDPNSAQFQDVARYKSGSIDIVCGSVNAKNAYGGYVGFKQFVVMDNVAFLREDYNAKQFDDLAAHFCKVLGGA